MIAIVHPVRTAPSFAAPARVRFGVAAALLVLAGAAAAAQVTIDGPAGSGEFGRAVTVLPNGNFVVTDPGYDATGPITDVGAVYLYRPDGTRVSTLTGSRANDRVGGDGVVVLANGNYVVLSSAWDNGVAVDAGAVTFGSGTSGIIGVVSATNSLVGSKVGDQVGNAGITALANGNYVVRSTIWGHGAISNAGAVTFGSGTSGVSGVVSPANSLVGTTEGDQAGGSGIYPLSNGNYVVASPSWDFAGTVDVGAVTFASGTTGIVGFVNQFNSLFGSTTGDQVGGGFFVALNNGNYVVLTTRWDNGAAVDAGAATFGSGTSGISGAVSVANSLVGSTTGDRVGSNAAVALNNGNYVVRSPFWDNGAAVDAGAATFGSGTSGISGAVSATNSLVGSTASDRVGNAGIFALGTGNYVVLTTGWDNGATSNVGAATFGSGTSGISGAVSPGNSLIGSTAGDAVGNSFMVALNNGNYVVGTGVWDNGVAVDAGAATFGSGITGIIGVVSPANSLVGTKSGDAVSGGLMLGLSNGNYLVRSPGWDNGTAANAGAVTFGSGTSGVSGEVSATNSLVGSAPNDLVGLGDVVALGNGNYVVGSPSWDAGAVVDAGAVTFGSGTSGISGVVSAGNSLVGSTPSDTVGFFITALGNSDYVVRSANWDNGAIGNVGAVTFGSGTSGITGVVSPANSLVGSAVGDGVGDAGVMALANSNYLVPSPRWDNGAIVDAGAVTLGLSNGSVVGPITSTHSVLGTAAGQGVSQAFGYDAFRNQLAVGQPASNRVVLQRTGIATTISIIGDTPDPSLPGQPVTFTATVSATPNAPTNGQVTFTASSGETCVDASPTPTTATTATFSCTIAFATAGISSVIAEYTGSIIHAYSGIDSVAHTTVAVVFADGFEGP